MIAIVKDRHAGRDRYLGEMLSMWGATCWTVVDVSDLAGRDGLAVIVPPDSLAADSARACLAEGRHLILIAPTSDELSGLGVDYARQYGDDGSLSRMRLVHPLLGTFSRHPLPLVGRRTLPSAGHYAGRTRAAQPPAQATVLAYQFDPAITLSDRSAIWTMPLHGGRLTVLDYDLTQCLRDLRQGRPQYADWRPPADDICRPSYLFGPDWASQHGGGHLPTADLQAMLLLRLIEIALPDGLPRLWQLPGLAESALLLSGDEDCGGEQHNESICSFLDGLQARMTIYVLMRDGRLSPQQLAALRARGHAFSAHPYPFADSGEFGGGSQPLAKLEAAVMQFRNEYGLPTPILRNHRLYWVGYVEVPKLWQRLGVRMDACCVSGNILARDFDAYYMAPAAALPLPFLDESCRLIDVYQQPVGASDDGEFSAASAAPKSKNFSPEMFEVFADALLNETLRPLGLPFAFIYHPCNFGTFAYEAETRFIRRAHQLGARLLSDHEWLDFWTLRAGWRLRDRTAANGCRRYFFAGTRASNELTVSLPGAVRARIDGREATTRQVTHVGEPRTLVAVPDGVTEVTIECEAHG